MELQDDSQVLRCYKCNQIGHIKANCPSNEEWSEKSEKRRFDERRTKKAYIAWDDNDSFDGLEMACLLACISVIFGGWRRDKIPHYT